MSEILIKLLNVLIFPGFLYTAIVGLLFYGIHMKILAKIQRRIGPPISQPFKDFAKLMLKDTLEIEGATGWLFKLAPLIMIVAIVIAMMFVPVGMSAVFTGPGAIIVLLYLISAAAVGIILGGSASSSPYSVVGASRELALMLSYDISLVVIFVTVALKAGMGLGLTADFSLMDIVKYQLEHGAFITNWVMIPAFLAFMMIIPANLGLPPFDVVEAETEIAGGPMAEYTGKRLGLFYLANAMKIVLLTSTIVAMFLPSPTTGNIFLNAVCFTIKAWLIYFIGGTLVAAFTGRRRIDQAVRFYLTVPLGLSILSFALVLLGL
ncbi:Ech-type complex subunit Ech1B [Thermoanaerobacter kivui]|uniref:Ech-type complex subunit Ech1B n=1 Tax=Thermoanaerobacter kivui TaxID=2325 RepID=A0A097AND8_THEKI|nr:complex I subunit 1 family protein [Thermoanaerobacter kivui]AIS51329.1 Ech-type complex subunit Ech1B [Thermoanaerobacter kivui]